MRAANTQEVTPAPELLEDRFREAFKRLAATVTVVSYYTRDRRPVGMTATSVCSLSLSPPSLVICVNRDTKTHEEIERDRRVGVNILSFGQERIAEHCSRPGQHKALPSDWLTHGAGVETPAIENALAHVDCEVPVIYPKSTHSIFIGDVTDVWLGPEGEPLMYCNRCYRNFRSQDDAEAFSAFWNRIGFGVLS